MGGLALTAIALSLVPVPTLESAIAREFLAGDLDGNSRVDRADLDILSRYLRGEIGLEDAQIEAADINRDGFISSADYSQLEQTVGASATRVNSEVALDSAHSGLAIDRATGQPLANVEVKIPGAGISVRTDERGRFTLPENVPSNEILVAELENYTPHSQTTRDGDGQLRVELERLDESTTFVLESDVVHLGDDAYSSQSAAAGQFRLRSQGREMARTFILQNPAIDSPVLKVGSLIGLDTAAAYRIGQTQLPTANMTPLEVELNGRVIRRIDVGGDNISIPLPVDLLQVGTNTVVLRTGRTTHTISRRRNTVSFPIFGGSVRFGGSHGGGGSFSGIPVVDYDDIELANVSVVLAQPQSSRLR